MSKRLNAFGQKCQILLFLHLALFSKGLIHAFGQEMSFFFYLQLVKIRLDILLSDFAEKKETCFDYKKQNFSKSKKIHFSKGKPIYAFGQKMPFFSLVRFGQNKTRNNA